VTNVLDWTEKTAEIPAGGLGRTRSATGKEAQAVAQALSIRNVAALSVQYRIVSISGAAYRLSGSLTADVEQACVVSLDPVAGKVDATFDVEFWPDLANEESDEETSVLEGSDVERLDHGTIPVGRIAFETLSASLDPYPRREGAEFTWADPKAEEAGAPNPFAALAKLKDKR
jgi:uncharacterized metal-binding protein YceD (DUF177 family)